MEKVYGFTNEYVASYQGLYDFNDKKVLSVIGSGDQYFTAILNGAERVDVYDINIVAWYHFVLKFVAIKYLSYEDFCKFFFTNNLHDVDVYLELRECLPSEVKQFFDNFVKMRIKFSTIKINQGVYNLFTVEDFKNFIPFLKKENYYKLQGLLKSKKLPKCYINDISKIMTSLNANYDLMLLSNIFAWIDMDVMSYKNLLDSSKIPLIQAHYLWHKSGVIKDFLNEGFTLDVINATYPSEYNEHNYVLTYTK